MKTISITLVTLLTLFTSYYFVYQTDNALLGDEVLLEVATTDVLGNPVYGKSCPRSAYASNAMNSPSSNMTGVAIFKFNPVVGKEILCPPITVVMDRRTAEAWIE